MGQRASEGQGKAADRGARVAAGLFAGGLQGASGARLSANVQAALHRFHRQLMGWIELEIARRRLFNWLPVCMGIGIGFYFAADREPALWAPVTAAVAATALALALRARPALFAVIVAVAAMFVGFSAAVLRTMSVNGPVLDRPRVAQLTGFVESVEKRSAGSRIVVIVTSFAELAPEVRPLRIRATLASGSITPGDHIAALARLLPPPEPARPGGYDFARDAFFRGIGAVGSISGSVKLAPTNVPVPAGLALSVAIDKARNALTERIARTIGGQAGAVATALVTGKRGLITEETNDALRAAGLYHVVSISGLHMVLAAGTIFWLVRALLTLSTTLALSWPVKKIAAAGAMVGATGYCIFSGSDVATERSLVMTLIMLGAILVDRPALSMRNLALAAIVVLLREPETMLGPSFQMSFAAVAALIAFNERWEARKRIDPPPIGRIGRVLRMLRLAAAGILVTTALATAATAPFGAFHFQTFNPYGLIGNALALPFISLVVMPAAVVGVLAYPFGLDGLAWTAMGWATVPFMAVAHWVATIERSTVVVPAFGPLAVTVMAAGLLWTTLWTTRLRVLALVPIAAGIWLAATPRRADIHIDRDGAGAAIRGVDGKLVVAGKPSRFVLAQWLTADGDGRKVDDPRLTPTEGCDAAGCVVKLASGRQVSFIVSSRSAIAEDCQRADLVVTPLVWRAPCKAELIDRRTLDRLGTLSLTVATDGWTVNGVRSGETDRPWLKKPRTEPLQRGTAATAPSRPSTWPTEVLDQPVPFSSDAPD
jgi:competence protein ComEC